MAWWRPADALVSFAAGATAMLPPTVATLAELARSARPSRLRCCGCGSSTSTLLPAPSLDADGALAWHLVHDRTREPVAPVAEPHAGQTDGVGR